MTRRFATPGRSASQTNTWSIDASGVSEYKSSVSLVSRRAARGEHDTCTPAALQHDLTLAAAEWAMQQRASEAGYTQHARKESLQTK